MFCSNCGTAFSAVSFCSKCGSRIAPPPLPPQKPTFWKRLANAVAMQIEIESRAANLNAAAGGRTWSNPDGSWSHVNDASGNSVISDGQNIFFTR